MVHWAGYSRQNQEKRILARTANGSGILNKLVAAVYWIWAAIVLKSPEVILAKTSNQLK